MSLWKDHGELIFPGLRFRMPHEYLPGNTMTLTFFHVDAVQLWAGDVGFDRRKPKEIKTVNQQAGL